MKVERPNNKYILFSAVFTAIGAAATLIPAPLWLRGFLAAIYFIGNGYIIGRITLTNERLTVRALIGSLMHIAALMIAGSAVYLFYRLNLGATIAVMIASPLLTVMTVRLSNWLMEKNTVCLVPEEQPPEPEKTKHQNVLAVAGVILSIAFFAFAVYGLGLLDGAATELSIRSPWDYVPRLFFIVMFVMAAGTLALSAGRLAGVATLLPLVGLSMLATTVAATVYAIGFGFDPFIHQATENNIFTYGEMTPKPPYYLGQYAFITILARMLGGHVNLIDIWLVPLAFAVVIPVAYWSLRRSFGWDSPLAAAACVPLLALPLSSFVMTTPQGLANILLLITTFILLVSATTNHVRRLVPAMLAVATISIHPLAGVPLLLFVAMVAYLRASDGLRRHPEIRWAFFVKLTVVACIALPVMFIINSRLSGAGVTLDQETLRTPAAIIEELKNPELETRRFSAALDFVYFWRISRTAIWSALAAIGALLFWFAGRRKKDDLQHEAAVAFGAGAVAFFVNYVLLRTWVRFPFLIEYERTNYADRMAELALFIAAPLALYAVGRFMMRMRKNGFPTLTAAIVLLTAAIIAANTYIAYPRRDRYESSRGWSTSAADVKAVQTIDNDSADKDYVVLANQSVSAAAIRELGFKKYYESTDENSTEPIFFYPIPTGGQLYEIFLDTNEQSGATKTVQQAMNLTSTDVAYYVVNHYWWQAQQIIIKAKKEADTWWEIDDKIWVFKYTR